MPREPVSGTAIGPIRNLAAASFFRGLSVTRAAAAAVDLCAFVEHPGQDMPRPPPDVVIARTRGPLAGKEWE